MRRPSALAVTGSQAELAEVARRYGVVIDLLKDLKERRFVTIDRDSIDDVMRRMSPGLNITVDNTIQDDGSEMPVQLKFESMKDFEPARVVVTVTRQGSRQSNLQRTFEWIVEAS